MTLSFNMDNRARRRKAFGRPAPDGYEPHTRTPSLSIAHPSMPTHTHTPSWTLDSR
ncbi:hypothetical protein BU24DRAFT_106770 [Aaosphaeria arxii CBS 175.79]|uniref:Uncharacterized protein n=1 Tax=Aaosphaeria arxii CBS 175.79 TaxID=1450172 RepID=A0A6A5Y1C3_9PLEO|nr:uncharacterized protein BU24DRAFT_106770 [Aaosphaeria arxii CBS 175.79]KAF2018867.1 hypothetical protein BU24DRAFT_106770 [Aaosphaeria arxii CBS 175.79]